MTLVFGVDQKEGMSAPSDGEDHRGACLGAKIRQSFGCAKLRLPMRGPRAAVEPTVEYTGLGFRAKGRAGAGAGGIACPRMAFEARACPGVSY